MGVETWWWRGLALARGEGVVGLVEVRNGHDELTSHHVELVLALERSGDVGGLGGTDSQTELVERDLTISADRWRQGVRKAYERHPLLVEDIATSWDVGGNVTTDRVTDVLGSVRVELSSRVTVRL